MISALQAFDAKLFLNVPFYLGGFAFFILVVPKFHIVHVVAKRHLHLHWILTLGGVMFSFSRGCDFEVFIFLCACIFCFGYCFNGTDIGRCISKSLNVLNIYIYVYMLSCHTLSEIVQWFRVALGFQHVSVYENLE